MVGRLIAWTVTRAVDTNGDKPLWLWFEDKNGLAKSSWIPFDAYAEQLLRQHLKLSDELKLVDIVTLPEEKRQFYSIKPTALMAVSDLLGLTSVDFNYMLNLAIQYQKPLASLQVVYATP